MDSRSLYAPRLTVGEGLRASRAGRFKLVSPMIWCDVSPSIARGSYQASPGHITSRCSSTSRSMRASWKRSRREAGQALGAAMENRTHPRENPDWRDLFDEIV